jgi:hypothetical protein
LQDSHPSGLTPAVGLNAYNSVSHSSSHGLFTMAGFSRQGTNSSDTMIVSHSSRWKAVKEGSQINADGKKDSKSSTSYVNASSSSNAVRTVEGGYKSLDDDYTYVRGRGRGRYVCNSCGIRCKKPSMLKKHIRTHSNFRPYTCKHCNFAFKTKGNLTKHMKSKTHHKKCVELGISPVPTSVPDDYNGATGEPGVAGPSGVNSDHMKPEAGDSDSDSDDMDEDEDDEDDDQFEDAEADDDIIEIIPEDNGLAAKGLVAFRPRLSTYPYSTEEQAKKEPSEGGQPDEAQQSGDLVVVVSNAQLDLKTSGVPQIAREALQLPNAQAPSIGEKYYFSKSPISNEVAKAAAATVMAIASSALSAKVVVKKTEVEIVKQQPHDLLLNLQTSTTVVQPTLKSASSNSKVTTNKDPPTLEAYLQEKAAIKAATSNCLIHDEEKPMEVTIEKAPQPVTLQSNNDHHLQGPRNVTMNVMDMPSSSSFTNITSRPIQLPQLPQDVHVAIRAERQTTAPSPTKHVDSQTNSNIINLASPPNRTVAEVNQAEEQQNAASPNKIPKTTSSSSSSGGRFICNVCKKDFPTNILLHLHAKIHLFERPYRCDACAVSFRTNGHLQKHKRSSGHFNKVNINATFGEPSRSNPRPFYCNDCKIGFRIHGHLAKHLRSKSHIMKLENCGKLPIGMFAEMERLGTNLNEIDTSDCDASLESLKLMAARLYKNEKISVDMKHTNGLLSPGSSSSSDQQQQHQQQHPNTLDEIEIKQEPGEPPSRRILESIPEEPRTSPIESNRLSGPSPVNNAMPAHMALNLSIPNHQIKHLNNAGDNRRASFSSSGQDEPSTDSESVGSASSKLMFNLSSKQLLVPLQENVTKILPTTAIGSHQDRYKCSQCPQTLNDLKSLQIHQFVDHHHEAGTSTSSVANVRHHQQQPPQPQNMMQMYHGRQPPMHHSSRNFHMSPNNEGSISSDSGEGRPASPVKSLRCELCGLSNITSSKALQQVSFLTIRLSMILLLKLIFFKLFSIFWVMLSRGHLSVNVVMLVLLLNINWMPI